MRGSKMKDVNTSTLVSTFERRSKPRHSAAFKIQAAGFR